MTYQTMEEFNVTTPDGVLEYVASIWAGFIPLTLFVFFMSVLLATFFSTKRQGEGDFLTSLAVAGFPTGIIAVLLTLKDGLIDPLTLGLSIGVLILSVFILYVKQKR